MIDLIPNEEQQRIADSVAGFLGERLPVERHRRDHGRGASSDRDAWAALAELGVFGICIPEQSGGSGLTPAEEVLVFRELGRQLVSPAALGSVLAARIALACGRQDLLAGLLEGRRAAGIANALPAHDGDARLFQLFDAAPDDLLVGWDRDKAFLYQRSAFSGGEQREGLDPSVRLSHARLHGAVLAESAELAPVANLLTAAMLVGILEAVRDMAVQQSQTRVQFGAPIGSFQAIKHKCADMALGAEAAWAQTAYAAVAMLAGLPEAAFQAVNAKLIASNAAIRAARDNIQIHGGMGFTAEINAHLFLKRAHVLALLGGSPRELQRRLLEFNPA